MLRLLSIAFALLILTPSFSQTPAGVGNNNIIWLEANDLSGPLTDGYTWADKSGNGFDAIDIVDGSNVATVVSIGGNNYLRFAGIVDEQLVIADDDATTDLLDNASEFSVIVVFNTGTTDTRAMISKRLNSSNISWAQFYNTGFELFSDAGNTRIGGSASVAAASNPHISTMTVDASLSGASIKTFVDTDDAGSGGSNISIPDRTEDVLIGEFNDGDGRFFNGDIAEIIVYRDALNGGERLVLENYLSEKYGVVITADYFGLDNGTPNYADYASTYDDDIRGIGTENGTESHATSGFSSGLQLAEISGLDNTNEFVIFAHDAAVAHADNITANISDVEITDRWQKDYYVEASGGGVVDAASANVEFRFDFSEATLTYSGSPTDYVLLYRATTADDFTRVFANSYSLENTDQIVVDLPASRLQTGYYTLGRGTQLTSRTWYVLQNGDWSDPTTWTLDAGTAPIPDNDLNETPGSEDEVVIRNGKTVTIQATTNNLSLSSITVDGSLDITTSSGHDFGVINGQGTISISGSGGLSNFPDGSTTNSNGFGNPANGGLLVVEDALEFDQPETFRDVRILADAATDIVALGADLTINGDFNVRFGTLQFGDGTTTDRNFTVIGDFSVENNGGSQDGRVTTAVASNTRHQFNLYGDFLNEGTAQFSDRTVANFNAESTNGVVDFNLISATQDQRVDCNGLTYFYRIEIIKNSTDFTAIIQADDPGNFVLTGFANSSIGGDVDDEGDNTNAFGLITGSASIGTNVSVRLNITGNYSIGTDAKLIVSGGEVTKTGGAAITPYGTIEVTAGTLEVPSGSGITTRDNGQIIVSGGELWACQIRTSIQGAGAQGGFEQSGGTVNVWDYSAAESPILGVAAGTANATYARFCLTYEGNAFSVTGGTLNVKDETTAGLFFVNSDPANINVSGGTVNLYTTGTGAAEVATNAGFWDLNIIQEGTGNLSVETMTCGPGGADDRTITDPDLVVFSDLNIGTGAELVMNNNDLYIGEDLTIEENINGSTYQPGTNTTYFNGDLSGLITLNSTEASLGNGRLEFNNVILDKNSSGNGIFCAYNLPNFNGNVIRVNGDMTVERGFWNQGDENLDLQGVNVTNKGILGVFEPGVTEGLIVLRDNAFNLITTDGAQFGYIRDNNRFTINLTSDVYIQRLRWRRGLWNLGTNNLRIDQLDIRPNTGSNGADYVDEDGTTVCTNCLSANYMFSTAGNASDGGLSLLIRSTGINEGWIRSDNPAPRDVNDLRGNPIANTNGGGAGDNLFIFPVGIGESGIDIEFGDPSGTTTADTAKYTPLYLDIQDVTGVTEDSVYVTVRPVDRELQTTDLSGGDVLSFYWNVEHGYIGTTPSVTIQNDYYTDDLDGSANEALFVAGEVEDGGTYTRTYEDDNIPENEGVDDTNNRLTFNGDADTGLSLANVNLTAGETARFVGNPQIFYSNEDGSNADWDEGASWNSEAEITAEPVGSPGVTDEYDDDIDQIVGNTEGVDYPGPGDVALLGVDPDTGTPHSIRIERGITANAAEFRFVNNATITAAGRGGYAFLPELTLNSDGGVPTIAIDQIRGIGVITDRNNTDPDLSNVDLGDYINESTSFYLLENFDPTFTYQNLPSQFPNLIVTSDGFGNNDRTSIIATDIEVQGDLIIAGDANLELNDDTGNPNDGDIVVNGNFLVTSSYEVYPGTDIGTANERPELIFPGSNGGAIPDRTIEVAGNLTLNLSEARAYINNSGANNANHTLTVHGNIADDSEVDNSGFDLYENTDRVNLVLGGTGSNTFTRSNANAGSVPDLYTIQLNKSGIADQFSIDTEFTLPTPTTVGAQPVEIVNGLLILNEANIDITLADGTQGNFFIPNTNNSDASSGSGGLEIAAGTARINGDDVGIILDGILRISGGTLDMTDLVNNGNNFIQYGASDQAVLEVSAGSLLVGSQVRRPTSTSSGLLNYSQTGGDAQFGIVAAPESSRGVFELLGNGSEFTHTAGSFTVVRENGSQTVGSLIIKPDLGDLNVSNSTITIGSADTPANQDDIGIDSDVPLSNLLITGNNNPTAKIYNVQLEVDDLTIQSGGTFDANGFNLTIDGDYDNDGTYNNGGTDINQQTTIFPTTIPQSISGTGTSNFYNIQKNGNDVLTVGKDIIINNNLEVLDGTISTSTFAVNVEGDMTHDALHTSDPAGPGIVFNGSDAQNLDTSTSTGEFGVLTLDNSNGLEIPGDGRTFEINDKVILTTGVFNIGGNLLVMDEDAVFENGVGGQARADFNVNSMISVNASITDNGVRKLYADSYTGVYLYPVGLNYYTPAEVHVTDLSGSTGNDNQVTIKPIEDIAGGIPNDSDEICGSFTQDYVDIDNILQFYWLIRSANVEDFDGAIFLYHVDQLESVDNTEGLDLTNYAPARLLDASSNWDKAYSADQFDESNNIIEFRLIGGGDYTGFTSADIAGTYTAGITVESNSGTALCGGAIPDVVPEYVTIATATTGDVDNLASYATAPGGTVPSLGESPDLRITGDFTLNLTDQFWRFRKVTIESDATLTVSGAGVNLGTVEGDGTLKLINTNTLPAGDYASFEADGACTSGGGFELEVTTGNSVDLTLPFNRLRRLILSGDGEKVVTNGTTFNICENLEIQDGGTLTMGDNTTFNIQGNLIKAATASFDGDFTNADIVMLGSSQQQIDGDFTGANQIKSLEVNNTAGLTVVNGTNDNVEIENLIMTDGIIVTDANNSLIILSTGDVTGSFGSNSFVNGPLVRRLETSTDANIFPVGDGTVYLPLEVSNTQGYTGTKDWTVEYHAENPTTSSLITNANGTFDFTTWNSETNTGNSNLFTQDLFEVEVASPATADVRPSWDGDSPVGADENSWQFLRVMVWSTVNETWESYGNANANYTGMTTSSGSIISDTDLTFSTNFITLGSNEPIPLPVELLSFLGVIEEGQTVLTWETASEVNNDFFDVQHSVDGENFESIGIVDGNGDSNEVLAYSFIHLSPSLGINYYRLRQVDFDGAEEIHETIRLENNGGVSVAAMEASPYPNPSLAENLNVRIISGDNETPYSVKVIDLTGQIYVNVQFPGALTVDEKLTPNRRMVPGIYFMIVQQGDKMLKEKIIIR